MLRQTDEVSGDDKRFGVPVPVAPARDKSPGAIHREATFLAQLIATREQLPQTRQRCRAEPAQATNAYRATAALLTKRAATQ